MLIAFVTSAYENLAGLFPRGRVFAVPTHALAMSDTGNQCKTPVSANKSLQGAARAVVAVETSKGK